MTSKFLKITRNKIYFSNNDFVSLAQTNFPEDSLSFRQHLDIFLEVELSNYDLTQKSLEIKIIDYSPEDTNPFFEQKLKKPIHKLIFKELEWSKLQSLLSSFIVTLPKKIPKAFKKEIKKDYQDKNLQKSNNLKNENQNIQSNIEFNILQLNDEVITYEVNFEVFFAETKFYLGYVSTTRAFEFYKHPIEFKIYNSFILPEYDYIKDYFSNFFESKSFNISAKIQIKGNVILGIDSHSEKIEYIDNKVIDNVKINRTLNLSKIETNSEKGKSIYTADEILSKLDKSENIFNQSEVDILSLIIESKSPRNLKQLGYLAGEKHEVARKIRFTLNPLFGFIFFMPGKKRNHICWELLDSHATYLWSFDQLQSIESQIQFSELNINTIREIGRMKYRTLIKNKLIDINSFFSVINHSKSKTKDDFEIWKDKLISKLI
jgi:hypothetical protein